MTIDGQTSQPLFNLAPVTDRDHLELLLYKLEVMKEHGKAWYSRKMPADEKLFEDAKKDCNNFISICKKRGYNYDRYKKAKPTQGKLL